MNDMLQQAIAGAPPTVTFERETYPLAYPIQGVILYKAETGKLDRERVKATGRAPLTRQEKRELRDRRRKLLAEADALRPEPGEKWDDDNFVLFDELLAEGITVKSTLDEDAGTGDSLYDKSNWWKISPESDPERMLLALWVGMHQFENFSSGKKVYRETLTRERLSELIDLRNGEELTSTIAKALRAHLIAPPEIEQDEEALPNALPASSPADIPMDIPVDIVTIELVQK